MEMNDEILELIKKRMEKGRGQYGHGLLENSGYDWVKEALEEALDLSIYVAARLVEVSRHSFSSRQTGPSPKTETLDT